MSDDTVNIEVDGKPVEAKKGQMVIEVTDAIGAYIPRFCYHEKLSIAANCRMCLVEVEKAPKPMPACATPVGEGMKIFTRSPAAIAAQKATMEFLLINHPLDCPICDQGGECELQDLALGYGSDVSRYNERKRVVKDKDLGPLVSTDMTRCIHCTRCVRFGEEIEGLQELGTMGRGENVQISTYIEKSVDHELSANIIDMCPVGALNNKPYRYSARAWEMTQLASVSPHDCVGSNMSAHVLRGTIKRVVPRENDAINETWISDRDRFSYEGIYSRDRLLTPRIRKDGAWQEISWDDALQKLAEVIRSAAADKVGILASPGSTVEECHLLSRLAEHVGSNNIDHRLRQQDFSDQENDPLMPWLGCEIAEVESSDAMLIVGSNLRKEVPIIAHRVRKAALAGAKVCFVNGQSYDYHFDVAEYLIGASFAEKLAGIAVAAAGKSELPASIAAFCKDVKPTKEQKHIAAVLAAAERPLVFCGLSATRHKAAAAVRALASAIADFTGARFGALSDGANSAGAHLAGVLPHRGPGGVVRSEPGLDADTMLKAAMDVVVLFGIDPEFDISCTNDAVAELEAHKFVVALTPFQTESLESAADLLLPIGTFAETSGTFVNCEARWQSFNGIANPVGEARPGWKVLRVLGNLLDAENFDYQTSAHIRDELVAALGEISPDNAYKSDKAIDDFGIADAADQRIDVPIYQVDSVVRRATALQLTPEAKRTAGAQS
ncbi:MAG: NADH-quinone oxidoreductase subunit G [Gammaproteobacteria bacterium]|nr:MAG: NADH-quinone oxidoreductase subunit G [Gammaproteobacteria bacterium]